MTLSVKSSLFLGENKAALCREVFILLGLEHQVQFYKDLKLFC